MLEIKSYMPKTASVEALQYQGGREEAMAAAAWVESFPGARVRWMGAQDFLLINSGPDWSTSIYKGDWIIRDSENIFRGLDDELFKQKYQEIVV